MTEHQDRKPKHDGIRQYERFILGMCNAEHFSLLNEDEKNGYYGIAMLLAFQDGAKPNLKEFAYRLRVSPLLLEEAFENLRANGVFSSIYLKSEPNSEGLDIDRNSVSNAWMDAEKRDLVDWCWVAGIAGGFCGIR